MIARFIINILWVNPQQVTPVSLLFGSDSFTTTVAVPTDGRILWATPIVSRDRWWGMRICMAFFDRYDGMDVI